MLRPPPPHPWVPTLSALAVYGSITLLRSMLSCLTLRPTRPRWNTKEWGTAPKSSSARSRAAERCFFWFLLCQDPKRGAELGGGPFQDLQPGPHVLLLLPPPTPWMFGLGPLPAPTPTFRIHSPYGSAGPVPDP